MQIVIDIPEEKYHGIVNMAEEILDASTFCSPRYLYKAVLNGTPLPKRHGRLVDMSEVLVKLMQYYDSDKTIGQCLDEVNIIIEADGGDAK